MKQRRQVATEHKGKCVGLKPGDGSRSSMDVEKEAEDECFSQSLAGS
ncbi:MULTISPECIES: hypothetical protein [unclassified Mesorhizobium]